MADQKVTDMTAIASGGMALTDELYANNAGVDKKVAFGDMSTDGVFTPRFGDGTNDIPLDTATGFYTRVGSMVHIDIEVTWSSGIGSVAGTQLRIDDLPFTCLNTSGYRAGTCIGSFGGINTSGDKQLTGRIYQNTTGIWFFVMNDNTSATSIAADTTSTSGSLSISATYRAN